MKNSYLFHDILYNKLMILFETTLFLSCSQQNVRVIIEILRHNHEDSRSRFTALLC